MWAAAQGNADAMKVLIEGKASVSARSKEKDFRNYAPLTGGGANTVTGDYSTGAAGLWIENGELAYPVSEITIAGNMTQMLKDVREVGSKLEFRSSIACPCLLIGEMTISGQ